MTGHLQLTQQVNAALSKLTTDIKSNRLSLPSPPENLLKLRELVERDPSATEVATLLQKEPHISARLIKLANSVLFPSRTPVSSVKEAVIRLGINKVKNLVTGFAITQQFITGKTAGVEKWLEYCWLKTNDVAAICSQLARHFSTIDVDNALLAGQIHNIGEPALIVHLNRMPELHDSTLRDKVIERVLTQLSSKVSVMILEQWQFPPTMIQLPLAVALSDQQSTLRLDNLLQLSVLLRHLNFSEPLSELPEALMSCPSFPLVWENEAMAIAQLNQIANDIIAAKQLLKLT